MGCAQGALSHLLVDPVLPFDASSEAYDFISESIAKQGRLIGGRGITGTRSNFANRTREGSYEIGGKIHTYTCAADLDNWLPRILGATEAATDIFEIADTLPTFQVMVDRVSGVFSYTSCYVDTAIWKGSAGPGDSEPELVEQILDIQCLAESTATAYPVTPPTLSVLTNRNPYIVADGTLTIGGTAYAFKDFVIVVRNHLQPRWVNSLTPTSLCPQDRTVMLRTTFPFTAAADAVLSGIYTNASRLTGATATIVMRPSGLAYGTTWTFTGLQWTQVSPVVNGKQEIELQVDFIARKTTTASEIVVTNDNTT